MTTVYDFDAQSINGKPVALKQFEGKVLLIVNTASACGFTPQLEGLQALHARHAGEGLVVIGFPSNEFGGQDPAPNAEIAQFCSRNYGVTFPMMAKVQVNGEAADPLWRWLKQERAGVLGTEAIKWNFTKFLIGRDGQVRARYAPQTAPDALEADIQAALADAAPQ